MNSSRNLRLTARNAAALGRYAELAGMTPAKFLYASVQFEALKMTANALPELT
jgi:hypothetical protein